MLFIQALCKVLCFQVKVIQANLFTLIYCVNEYFLDPPYQLLVVTAHFCFVVTFCVVVVVVV